MGDLLIFFCKKNKKGVKKLISHLIFFSFFYHAVHHGFREDLSLGRPNPIWSHFWISLCKPHLDMLLLPNKRLCLPIIDGLAGSIVPQGIHLCYGNLLEERGSLQSSRQNRRTRLGNSRGKSKQPRQQRFDQTELYPSRT